MVGTKPPASHRLFGRTPCRTSVSSERVMAGAVRGGNVASTRPTIRAIESKETA
ncbi:hypothetical protein DM39_3410 [Burkholderia cenocepacia]|uniref:Uncharacterized protein n=1 Tax=Burkholderia cenocepacia TaxID=95486 RepID=A0AAN0RV97_9BURK|nr:hypothetical protein DM39_3410 [Burkholderia cenocepacia]